MQVQSWDSYGREHALEAAVALNLACQLFAWQIGHGTEYSARYNQPRDSGVTPAMPQAQHDTFSCGIHVILSAWTLITGSVAVPRTDSGCDLLRTRIAYMLLARQVT